MGGGGGARFAFDEMLRPPEDSLSQFSLWTEVLLYKVKTSKFSMGIACFTWNIFNIREFYDRNMQ